MKNWKKPTLTWLNNNQINSGNPGDVYPCEQVVFTCGTVTCLTVPPDLTYPTGVATNCATCFDVGGQLDFCS